MSESFEQIIIKYKLLFKSLFLQLDDWKCSYTVAAGLVVISKNHRLNFCTNSS